LKRAGQLVFGCLELALRHTRCGDIGVILQLRNLGLVGQRFHAIKIRLRAIVSGLRGFDIRNAPRRHRHWWLCRTPLSHSHSLLDGAQLCFSAGVPLCVVSRIKGTPTLAPWAWLPATATRGLGLIQLGLIIPRIETHQNLALLDLLISFTITSVTLL